MGIVMPKDIFSLSGVFNLVFQVLGLGWDYIRLKAVKMMGEPVVKALEGGYDMFKTFATKGIDGIWEFLKDKFSDLKEIVIDAIKDMLITQVIQAGIKWLLSLFIPGAGFIKAIMAIKDLIVFFVESAMMLIPAITEAILALAAGSVAGVAKAIEFGLAKLIGLVINLFAKLIGLGGLTKKVQGIFKKIRKRVDKAVGKLLKKARKAGRKLMRKLGIGAKEKPKNKEQHDEQVKAGMLYLHQQEKAVDKDGNKSLTPEEANKVAAKTKKKFAVFTSITPKIVGGKWVYHWTGSQGDENGAKATEGEEGKGLEIKVGTAFSIRPNKNRYAAIIRKVQNPSRTFHYEFDYEKYRPGLIEMKFEEWDRRIKDGSITTIEKAYRDKIIAEANRLGEPLKSLILGTLGAYRSNLINDLRGLLKKEGGEDEFRRMYKNASSEFQSKMELLIGKESVSKDDLIELFKGFEAHHVIPANFLRNDPTVQKLLQSGVKFGYNDLDNLIFIPAGNHTQGDQRGHPEYDNEIRNRIQERVAPLVNEGKFPSALAELKKIIKEVKNKFINEIIGSDKNAKHV